MPVFAVEEEPDLVTGLMTSTMKIEESGSIGTGFLLGEPLKTDPSRAAYVLVTAAHVLSSAKGDTFTLHLRKKVADSYERIQMPLVIRSGGKGSNCRGSQVLAGTGPDVQTGPLPHDHA